MFEAIGLDPTEVMAFLFAGVTVIMAFYAMLTRLPFDDSKNRRRYIGSIGVTYLTQVDTPYRAPTRIVKVYRSHDYLYADTTFWKLSDAEKTYSDKKILELAHRIFNS